jgi:putative hydrolase of the HAD superfamily
MMLDGVNPKVILFDFYGTLANIKTDEQDIQPWLIVASYLCYRGAKISANELQNMYFSCVQESLDRSPEAYPDVNVVHIFTDILARLKVEFSEDIVRTIAQLFRSLTINEFQLFSETLQVLHALAKEFRLGLVSDSQEVYIIPELRQVTLDSLFETIVISSRYGYRKPDPRLFQQALKEMGLTTADDILYVGDNWECDIVGATNAGIKSVWIQRRNDQIYVPHDQTIPVIPDLRGLLCLIEPEEAV